MGTSANRRSEAEAVSSDDAVRDDRLRSLLASLSSDAHYWDFRRQARRDGLHGLTQYPAMMVPAMQGKLIEVLCSVLGGAPSVFDPFVGSGTTLVEAMRRGLPFTGQDINPLAVLICKAKAVTPHLPDLDEAIRRVRASAESDRRRSLDVEFPGLGKWFTPVVARNLAALRRTIASEPDLGVRRVLWLVLAETIRLTCNSRTSTFKLHIRTETELARRHPDAFIEFARAADVALESFRTEHTTSWLRPRAGADRGSKGVAIHLKHAAIVQSGSAQFDLLVTSPPYGDGLTTVPYGQYSYLPLQWIDLSDIDPGAAAVRQSSTHELDTRSLGGSRKDALARIRAAAADSPTLADFLAHLAERSRDHQKRVASFFADLAETLDAIVPRLREGGYMIWTVGNRHVGNLVQPLDRVLEELLQVRGCVPVCRIDRTIPSKRMATRNSISPTMRLERVLILRKGPTP